MKIKPGEGSVHMSKYVIKRALNRLATLLLFLVIFALMVAAKDSRTTLTGKIRLPDLAECEISLIELTFGGGYYKHEITDEGIKQILYNFTVSLRAEGRRVFAPEQAALGGSYARYVYSVEYEKAEYFIGFGLAEAINKPYEEPNYGQALYVSKANHADSTGKNGFYFAANETLYNAALEIVTQGTESFG
jgi:hypothetical protein